jgi:hypothetical protein
MLQNKGQVLLEDGGWRLRAFIALRLQQTGIATD